MNKYQKQKSKEIKTVMRIENVIGGERWRKNNEITYRQAKKILKNRRSDLPITPCGYSWGIPLKFKER